MVKFLRIPTGRGMSYIQIWVNWRLLEQMKKAWEIVNMKYPKDEYNNVVWLFDQSSGHIACSEDKEWTWMIVVNSQFWETQHGEKLTNHDTRRWKTKRIKISITWMWHWYIQHCNWQHENIWVWKDKITKLVEGKGYLIFYCQCSTVNYMCKSYRKSMV